MGSTMCSTSVYESVPLTLRFTYHIVCQSQVLILSQMHCGRTTTGILGSEEEADEDTDEVMLNIWQFGQFTIYCT